MSVGTDHLSQCNTKDCEECDFYLECCMACDQCGHWGDMECDSWVLGVFGVYCCEECKILSEGRIKNGKG